MSAPPLPFAAGFACAFVLLLFRAKMRAFHQRLLSARRYPLHTGAQTFRPSGPIPVSKSALKKPMFSGRFPYKKRQPAPVFPDGQTASLPF